MKKLYAIITTATLFIGCNPTPTPPAEKTDTVITASTDTTVPAPIAIAPVTTTYKTKTGKIFTIVESHPAGASLSNISVQFNGDADSLKMEIKDSDPINKVMVGDLDANGFDELYIVTVSAGSGSAGNVIGFSSNNDKSMSSIYFPPVEEKDLLKGGNFEGYEGHDEFEMVENSLSRRFPIKSEKATMRSINYKIKKGETGNILFIKNSTAY